MNKKLLIIAVVVVLVIILGIVFFSKNTTSDNVENTLSATQNSVVDTEENSNTIKNDKEEAEKQIEIAMQNLIKKNYGSDVVDSKIFVEKIYTSEEEQEMDVLKEMNLGPDEVAFEVKYELKIKEGIDPIRFTAATGEYDEETGWVKEKYNVGILRPNGEGYTITDFGTGF